MELGLKFVDGILHEIVMNRENQEISWRPVQGAQPGELINALLKRVESLERQLNQQKAGYPGYD